MRGKHKGSPLFSLYMVCLFYPASENELSLEKEEGKIIYEKFCTWFCPALFLDRVKSEEKRVPRALQRW
jgi:hypothetical protein